MTQDREGVRRVSLVERTKLGPRDCPGKTQRPKVEAEFQNTVVFFPWPTRTL